MRRCKLYWLSLLSLLSLTIAKPVSTADFEIDFYIPERIELNLSTEIVDLGMPLGRNPIYYEKLNAVKVDFRCNLSAEWEVRIYGADFRDGDKKFPISKLQWKEERGSYKNMPPEGGYALLARRRDFPKKKARLLQSKNISYRLELTGDESGGAYSAPIIYTLFVP